ncbi:MAG: hypothetical protein SWJ54_21205 [Cyanobacteriota bacterium]|nr:hypothetical protein [Cyanobacteriota bacterium]
MFKKSRTLKRIVTVFLSLSFFMQPARSQDIESILLTKSPKLCFWENEEIPPPPLSQTELSIPSLWLAEELYGYSTLEPPKLPSDAEDSLENRERYKILETWYVEPKITQLEPDLYVNNLVTLVVNRINWNRERYMGQYIFVSRFASVTRRYGYNLRVCNRQGDLLAYYVCDFDQIPSNCEIEVRSAGFGIRDFREFKPETTTPE